MKSNNQRQLKNLILNPKFQFKYIFWTTAMGMLLVVVNALVFYFHIKENYKILVDLSPMNDDAKIQLYTELNQIVVFLVVFSIVFIFLISIMGLLFSHRVVGPMYNMRRVFEEISSGKRDSRVKLRPNDEFQEVAESCNKMIDSLMSDK